MNLTTLSARALLEYNAELERLSRRSGASQMRSSYLACQLEIKRRAEETAVYATPNPFLYQYLFDTTKLLKSRYFGVLNHVKTKYASTLL